MELISSIGNKRFDESGKVKTCISAQFLATEQHERSLLPFEGRSELEAPASNHTL